MSGGQHPNNVGPNQPYGFMAFGPMSPQPQQPHPQIQQQHQQQLAMANPNPYGPVFFPPPPHSPPVLHPQQQQHQQMIAFYPGNPIPYVISAQPHQGQGRPHSQRIYPAMAFGYPYPQQQQGYPQG